MREASRLADRQRTQVIDAVHVVGVRVRKQHGVDPIDAGRDELEPQLGRRVDQKPRTSRLDERSRARALVAGVGGCTGWTATADLRHAERCTRAEKNQPHITPSRP